MRRANPYNVHCWVVYLNDLFCCWEEILIIGLLKIWLFVILWRMDLMMNIERGESSFCWLGNRIIEWNQFISLFLRKVDLNWMNHELNEYSIGRKEYFHQYLLLHQSIHPFSFFTNLHEYKLCFLNLQQKFRVYRIVVFPENWLLIEKRTVKIERELLLFLICVSPVPLSVKWISRTDDLLQSAEFPAKIFDL